ncbi:MAG: YhjD/YihY/BrkB family envelope integrity protein [Candidatus Alcyoniella australis]|nr:YhjD/YihY/BrkB family envelope integrity protein [Candidatus Alcyoniella australis]
MIKKRVNSGSLLRDLFLHDLASFSWWRAWLLNLMRFLVELFAQYNRDACVVRSAGLSYTSLLALVPLMVVAFSIFTSFSAFASLENQIKTFVTEALIPGGVIETDLIRENLDSFAANAHTVRYVGMIAFFITAILFFNTIESALNNVWKVDKRRSIMGKFFSFTAVIVWGPLLIGLSMLLTAKVKDLLDTGTVDSLPVLKSFFLLIFQYMVAIGMLTVTFLVVPHTRVKLRSAILGGTVAGVLWELAKMGFTYYVGNLVSINKIYGSLSVLPIFLIWLYLTWLIVLLGAETAYVHQNFRALMMHRINEHGLSPRQRAKLAITLFYEISRRFFNGDPQPTIEELVELIDFPLETINRSVSLLERAGLVALVSEGSSGLLPVRSISRIKVSDVVAAVYNDPPDCSEIQPPQALHSLESRLDQLVAPLSSDELDLSFAELIELTSQSEPRED